ncbi:MlrC family protein 8 [Skermanella stibiiresistens SB22]|uniref:Microcystinase C n=1 Tax=Skermanella stibiiresistens SB22 TaxID=1385369 RepID=W9GUV3_9PROT|nr:M81 family metallopeptidase [Skermanella stibiiresistens]EWY36207.1 MlrC family protein 8 [Skermanella stibiiresistens SB22]
MRVVIALLKHETNTFSPVPTPLERFGNGGPAWGSDAYNAYRGTATPMGAFIDLAEAEGAEIVTPVAAEAWPSGPVSDDAYMRLTGAILEEVAKGCDCVLLDLHGAMVTESLEDGEGELLARVRKLAPDVPIGVALDLHGNLSEKIVSNATAVAGFKTYPHVDMYETGERVGRITLGAVKGTCRPAMAWGSKPMLPHVMRMGTAEAPMRDLVDEARRLERDGALAVSVFGGFPHADIRDAGIGVVTVTEGDLTEAKSIRDGLLEEAWRRREEFVYHAEPLAQSVARAARLADGPVLILDHSDNCGSGGTQDVTTVLAEIIRQDLKDVVAFAIHDPAAVARLIEAGVGARVTLDIGGKLAMPAIGLQGRPLTVSGVVRVITDGEYTIRGPMYTGVRVGMGRTVVLDTGSVEIVLIERHHEPWDLGCLLSLGIDPAAKRHIMLKSRIHYRAGFQPIAKHIVECAGDGVTTSDYGRLHFERVRRPIYPLDDM